MILFINVFITNNVLNKYDRGLLGEIEDRLSVFKYSLASLAVINWDYVIIYYELDKSYKSRQQEVDAFINHLFNKPKIYHFRNDNQMKWQLAVNEVLKLDQCNLVWFTCNDDHIFIDYDISYLYSIKKQLLELSQEYKYISCYLSHWPEMVRMIKSLSKYGGEIIKDLNDFFLIKWRNIDSIQIINTELLRYWWFENDYGDATLVRTDTPKRLGGVPVISPDTVTLIPYRELVRHYDGYPHVGISINDCPPLLIPDGFFNSDIRIQYCIDKKKDGYLSINPFKDNYTTVDENGADLKCLISEIPIFWKDRVSEIDSKEYLKTTKLISARNRAVLRIASADRARTEWPPWQIVSKLKNVALYPYRNLNNIRLMLDAIYCWNLLEHGIYFSKAYPFLIRPLKLLKKILLRFMSIIKMLKRFAND